MLEMNQKPCKNMQSMMLLALAFSIVMQTGVQASSWVGVTLPNKKSGWIRSEILVFDINFSSKATLRTAVGGLKKGSEVEILGSRRHNFRCKQHDTVLWIEAKDLLPLDEDLGFVITKEQTHLIEKPSLNRVSQIGSGIKIRVIRFVDNFVEIEWEDKNYFIDVGSVLSRFHFASRVKTEAWHDVKSLLQNNIITAEDRLIKTENVVAVTTGRDFGYIVTNRANVRASRNSQSRVVSRLSGFLPIPVGNLYAGQNTPASTKPALKPVVKPVVSKPVVSRKVKPPKARAVSDLYLSKKSWTSDELFNRDVFDFANSPRVRGLIFASAKGVFRSTDGGKLWKKIDIFEDKNLPIAIGKNGVIYVGQHKSMDNGETFVPYVRWDLALKAIQYPGIGKVGFLSIADIRLLEDKQNTLQLDLNLEQGKRASIISHDGGQSWLPVID